MRTESIYKITVNNISELTSRTNILQFANHRRISEQVAEAKVRNLITVLENNIVQSRMEQVLRFFEYLNFTQFTCERVKRKYVRKDQVQVEEQPQTVPEVKEESKTNQFEGYDQPEDMRGLICPIGTLFRTHQSSDVASYYRIVEVNARGLRIHQVYKNDHSRFVTSSPADYNVTSFNNNVYMKQWVILNITPETQKLIDNYTNTVPRGKFEIVRLQKDITGHLSSGIAYIKYINGSVMVSPYITHNCQMNIIGGAEVLITHATNLKEQLTEIYKWSSRALALFDIRTRFVKTLQEKLPKEMIVSVQPYKSSNGSEMSICIIKIRD